MGRRGEVALQRLSQNTSVTKTQEYDCGCVSNCNTHLETQSHPGSAANVIYRVSYLVFLAGFNFVHYESNPKIVGVSMILEELCAWWTEDFGLTVSFTRQHL